MNDPAVLFYTSDFLTGVMDMTMEERGQYITLLCYQHQKGHIKEETIRLLVGYVSVNVLKHFEVDENGEYFNKRMDIEKEKRHVFTESRRANGLKGGRPKIEKEKPSGKPKKNLVVNHMANHMGNENENDNININYNKNNIYYEEEKLNNIFKEFLDIRKKLKAVNSDRAIKMLINKLSKYDDETKYKMIEQSIVNSWKDVYELKEQKKSSTDKMNEVFKRFLAKED